MSIETHQHTFWIGDLVEDEDGDRGRVDMGASGPYIGVAWEEGGHSLVHERHLTPVVCEYCASRKGCTCQEDIDAREADWFHTQMDAAERDHWTEDKDRRADEEGL